MGGSGEVHRPPNHDCFFLPQRPYMPLGTLRAQLLYPDNLIPVNSSGGPCLETPVDDTRLRALLRTVGLEDLPDRFDKGFDTVRDWVKVLSAGEQQRVALVRCFLRKPK